MGHVRPELHESVKVPAICECSLHAHLRAVVADNFLNFAPPTVEPFSLLELSDVSTRAHALVVGSNMLCCGRATSAQVILPGPPGPEPGEPSDHAFTSSTDAKPEAPATAPGSALSLPYPSMTAAAATSSHPDAFSVTFQRGNGATFTMSIYPDITVNELHKQISALAVSAFGRSVPSYALRIVFKTHVMSMYGERTVDSFGIAEGDTLQLAVVRDGACEKQADEDRLSDRPGAPSPSMARTMNPKRRFSMSSSLGGRRASKHNAQVSATVAAPADAATAPGAAPGAALKRQEL